MKLRLIIGAFALLLSGPALGQATMTTNITAAENTALTAERLTLNASICASVGVPQGCNQATARAAFCTQVGLSSGCAYTAARDAWCAQNSALGDAPCPNVPVIVISGNAAEVFGVYAQRAMDALRAAQRVTQGQSMCGPGGIWRSKDRTAKDALCTSPLIGLANGCNLCPN